MTEKRFKLVKCIENHWGLVDTLLDDTDQLVLIHTSKSSVNYLVNLLNSLADRNEELQTRNDRQANSLDELYNLIEKEDWKALQQIIQDFKDCEEQLQREWAKYDR